MIPDLPIHTQPLVVSYFGLRRAIGVSGLLLPIVLWPVGWWLFKVPIQDNMSSYYYTPLRDVFVGTMFAIGVFLFCYRGNDWIENLTANVGCVAAIGVALMPLDPNSDPLLQKSWVGYVHTVCGGIFFVTLAFYSLVHFPRSDGTSDNLNNSLRNFVYRASGIVILMSLAVMGAYLLFLDSTAKQQFNTYHVLFWGEWIAVWAFSAAWLTKGRALVADLAVQLLATTTQMASGRKS